MPQFEPFQKQGKAQISFIFGFLFFCSITSSAQIISKPNANPVIKFLYPAKIAFSISIFVF